MKTIFRIIGVLFIVAGTVLLGGCPKTSGSGGDTSIIGTWELIADMTDLFAPGVDIKAGATSTFAFDAYAMVYSVDDNGTIYNCSHSGGLTPDDPDSTTILELDVTVSDDGGGEDYAPSAPSTVGLQYSNLTATTVDIGVDMDNDGVIEFTMSCVGL